MRTAAPLLALLLAGCGPGRDPAVFQDREGARFRAPRGWLPRAFGDAPGGADLERTLQQGRQDLPLPRLGGHRSTPGEHLIGQYDRVVVGNKGWLRVTVADLPASTSLDACLAGRTPAGTWRPEADVEHLEVSGLPAARQAVAGRWKGQDYVCETVAVRRGGRVYFITASVPAADREGREQVRQAVAAAAWP